MKAKDLEIKDTDKYEYIMTYSFPCQDLSLAGKGGGIMLKIKDNIDLRELEKFGFELYEDKYYWKWCNDTETIEVWLKNKNIEYDYKVYEVNYYGFLDEVYDLIKADMVEKV